MFGSEIASGNGLPEGWNRSTIPCTAAVVDGLLMVMDEIQSAPPATCGTALSTGNICERTTPPPNWVV